MTLSGIINIAAPPLGAFLMEALPMQGVLAVDIGTAIIAIVCLIFMTIPQTARTTLSVKINIIGDMMQSLRYIFSKFGIKIMVLMVRLIRFLCHPGL